MLILATKVWPKRLKHGEAIFAVPDTLQRPKTQALEPLAVLPRRGLGCGLPFGRRPSKVSSTESTGRYAGSKI
jgi:hypothetical protein